MAGYVYRGTDFDASTPFTTPEPTPKRALVAACGSRGGYMRHRNNDEDACEPCNDANNAYSRDWKERVKLRQIVKGWSPAKCGTPAGYSAHRRHSVPICGPCQTASTARARELREEKRAA